MNIRTNDDAFLGCKHLNGLTGKIVIDKKTNEPAKGKSGKTIECKMDASSGSLYLRPDQYTLCN